MAARLRSSARHQKSRDDRPQPEYFTRGDGPPEYIPFQLGDHTCWAVRAPGRDAHGQNRDLTSLLGEFGVHRISGWLRIADQSYVLVSETSDTNGGTDRLSGETEPWEMLSARETEIAVLVSRGKGTKQIAGHLHISEHTVRSYMRRIFSKLRVSTRPAMVARLMQSGIALADLVEPHTGIAPPAGARGAKSGL
jgi:DNA-binding CsgD family transcriptional regulator